jgi:hypothetical protein
VTLGDLSDKERMLPLLLCHHLCRLLMVQVNQVEVENLEVDAPTCSCPWDSTFAVLSGSFLVETMGVAWF